MLLRKPQYEALLRQAGSQVFTPIVFDIRPKTATFQIVNEKDQKFDSIIAKAQPTQICEPCWVQCTGYRCLAVRDKNGKWRSYATGKELTDFIKVCIA